MDIAKYLESRGWKREKPERFRYWKGAYWLTHFTDNHYVSIVDTDFNECIFWGKLPTEEFADQLMEALGIT